MGRPHLHGSMIVWRKGAKLAWGLLVSVGNTQTENGHENW